MGVINTSNDYNLTVFFHLNRDKALCKTLLDNSTQIDDKQSEMYLVDIENEKTDDYMYELKKYMSNSDHIPSLYEIIENKLKYAFEEEKDNYCERTLYKGAFNNVLDRLEDFENNPYHIREIKLELNNNNNNEVEVKVFTDINMVDSMEASYEQWLEKIKGE